MKALDLVLIVLNLSLVGLFAFLFTRRRRLLTYHLKGRRVWLTWLSIGATPWQILSWSNQIIL